MKVDKKITENGKTEIHIVVSNEDANLLQTAAIQFADKVAHIPAHSARMRRLAMLLDKKIE